MQKFDPDKRFIEAQRLVKKWRRDACKNPPDPRSQFDIEFEHVFVTARDHHPGRRQYIIIVRDHDEKKLKCYDVFTDDLKRAYNRIQRQSNRDRQFYNPNHTQELGIEILDVGEIYKAFRKHVAPRLRKIAENREWLAGFRRERDAFIRRRNKRAMKALERAAEIEVVESSCDDD